MPDGTKSGLGGKMLGTPGRCSFAGACVSLLLTVFSFAGICVIILNGTPGFIPASWPYWWLAEVFLLWCMPFFLAIWKLTEAVLSERYILGARDTLDRPPL
jgi:hypothetical protein